jgi:hypothetical protein
MSNKAKELIPQIIEAKNEADAIGVLKNTMKLLHLSTSYSSMGDLRDRLDHYQREFRRISQGLAEEGVIIEYSALNHMRANLSFLYRDIQDELSAPINSNKIFYEEIKTTRRAEGLKELRESDIARDFKANSTNALKEILGASETYAQYANDYAIAYGNFKTLDNLLNAVRLSLDSIASREKYELIVLQKDAK